MTDPARWTTPAQIAAAVRRRWDDGTLLRAFATGQPCPVIEVPLRGPSAGDLGEHFDAARAWAAGIRSSSRDGRAYEVVTGRIGGRLAGATAVPVRAVVDTYDRAWRVLGTATDAAAFRALIDAADDHPAAREWALRSPLAAVALADEWRTVLIALRWLESHRGSGLYLRQVTAPGVDTKFIERYRSALAAMLGVPARSFAAELGFATKPTTVRLRFAPGVVAMPAGLSEAVLRTDELRSLAVRPRRALIVENEITYLSVPVPDGGVVLWGKGYDADQPASLEWLDGVDIGYWGDLDTHGFGILHRVRTWLPQTRSVLMDRETLLAHEDRWGVEPTPTSAALPSLDAAEAALYADLVTDRYGSRVRLEQERIDWRWALQRLEQ
ncbi:Wadjet anti-phage system protein JetD domain-containing protein [Microbacterium aurum]